VQNELVQEAARFALVVALIFSLVDVATKVACRLIVDVVFILDVVDVRYGMLARVHAARVDRHTILVVHRELPLDLLADVLHGHLDCVRWIEN
jgi:hypothetical protein